MNSENNPVRQIPPDLLLLVFGFWPMIFVAMLASQLMNLRGWPWLAGYGVAAALALGGSASLLWAKWPMYRAGKFFTWGASGLPENRHRIYRLGMWLSGMGCGAMVLLVLQSLLWW